MRDRSILLLYCMNSTLQHKKYFSNQKCDYSFSLEDKNFIKLFHKIKCSLIGPDEKNLKRGLEQKIF